VDAVADATGDRTAKARILDVALTLFAERGIAGTSVRAVADAVGVSPALVIHHFGSKSGLRRACDEHVARIVRHSKRDTIAAGIDFDPMAALRRQRDGPPLQRYLARALVESSAESRALFDRFVTDVEEAMEAAREAGMVLDSRFPRERAVLLVGWTLGGFVLHEHLERHLGVDVSDLPDEPAALEPYMGPMIELFAQGLLTPDVAKRLAEAFSAGVGGKETTT
jgi:AcrR family transcriptional regulator